jgi:hypothetical protein
LNGGQIPYDGHQISPALLLKLGNHEAIFFIVIGDSLDVPVYGGHPSLASLNAGIISPGSDFLKALKQIFVHHIF